MKRSSSQGYVDYWPQAFKKNIGLLLFGDVGTGKSFLAGCIANALLERDVPVLMTNFPTILSRLCGTFGENRTAFLDSLGDYDLLIIDDLGVERNTEYAMEQNSQYRQTKAKMIELLTAKNNVERILGVTEKEKNRNRQQEAR